MSGIRSTFVLMTQVNAGSLYVCRTIVLISFKNSHTHTNPKKVRACVKLKILKKTAKLLRVSVYYEKHRHSEPNSYIYIIIYQHLLSKFSYTVRNSMPKVKAGKEKEPPKRFTNGHKCFTAMQVRREVIEGS